MDKSINLKQVLEDHKKWLEGDLGGERANLYGANLYGADLSRADLSRADLSRANLYGADLSRADLSRADLSRADLSRADLYGANLSRANLYGANLSRADLYGADHLDAVENLFYPICCPESGAFIGWKKAWNGDDSVIVELQITEDAKRCSASGRKCRCSKAVVLSIKSIDGERSFDRAVSDRDSTFVYEVGKTVFVDDFDENRWNECSTGIHFFITREEAVRYCL